MTVLVTGGTGVIGAGAIPELLRAGHTVRLLSRGAEKDARQYPDRIEPFPGDVTDPESIRGAAEGCAAVLHIAGIVEERPPEITFEKVNVAGTHHILNEAERAGATRFIYVSSLGADTGSSDYHASKRRAEEIVRNSSIPWLILRPGNVYGPGDDVISLLLKMVRTLPAIPVVGKGDQRFQPIWFEDLARAIAQVVSNDALSGRTLELAGDDVTTTRDILTRFSELTARQPAPLPIPEWLARTGTSVLERVGPGALEKLGMKAPVNTAKLDMLLDENVIPHGRENALTSVFHIEPTPLDDGLRHLADLLPELTPGDGVGGIQRKLYWAEIKNPRYTPSEFMRTFGDRITELMPIEFAAEPQVPTAARTGETFTGTIPGRGNFQVRVEKQTATSVTLATLEGHPLAGTVEFRAEAMPGGFRFVAEICLQAANIFDYIALRLGGATLQDQNWKQLVTRAIELSGGVSPEGVQFASETLSEAEEQDVQENIEEMINQRKRGEHEEITASRN